MTNTIKSIQSMKLSKDEIIQRKESNIYSFKAKIKGTNINVIGSLHYTNNHYIIFKNEKYNMIIRKEIDMKTLCRPTWKRDKNGLLVFEHDIINEDDDLYYIDFMDDGNIWSTAVWNYGEDPDRYDDHYNADATDAEIISSTMDEPKYLKMMSTD